MPLHIGPYLADTMHLRAAEHGAYLLLLMHYWRNGPLPDDDGKLAGIARMDRREWAQHGPVVREFFSAQEGRLHQKRADAERAKALQLSSKRREVAEARWRAEREQTACKPDAIACANAPAIAEQEDTHARVAIPLPQQEEVPKASPSGADAPGGDQGTDIRTALWRDGIPIVRRLTGKSDSQVRTILGRLLRDGRDDCARLYGALREAENLRPADPIAWLTKAVGARASPHQRPLSNRDQLASDLMSQVSDPP
jgi:uncharacterized protein YdaU (DUF1376 family)